MEEGGKEEPSNKESNQLSRRPALRANNNPSPRSCASSRPKNIKPLWPGGKRDVNIPQSHSESVVCRSANSRTTGGDLHERGDIHIAARIGLIEISQR